MLTFPPRQNPRAANLLTLGYFDLTEIAKSLICPTTFGIWAGPPSPLNLASFSLASGVCLSAKSSGGSPPSKTSGINTKAFAANAKMSCAYINNHPCNRQTFPYCSLYSLWSISEHVINEDDTQIRLLRSCAIWQKVRQQPYVVIVVVLSGTS